MRQREEPNQAIRLLPEHFGVSSESAKPPTVLVVDKAMSGLDVSLATIPKYRCFPRQRGPPICALEPERCHGELPIYKALFGTIDEDQSPRLCLADDNGFWVLGHGGLTYGAAAKDCTRTSARTRRYQEQFDVTYSPIDSTHLTLPPRSSRGLLWAIVAVKQGNVQWFRRLARRPCGTGSREAERAQTIVGLAPATCGSRDSAQVHRPLRTPIVRTCRRPLGGRLS